MTVNTEDIYRAMGWRQSRWNPEFWHDPTGESLYDRLADPLTDWSAFGEIMEWAQANGHLTATINGGMSVIGWVHLWLVKHPEQDFRETFITALTDRLAALESAIGGTE